MPTDFVSPVWTGRLAVLGVAMLVSAALLLRARGRLLILAPKTGSGVSLDALLTPIAGAICGGAMPLLRNTFDFDGFHADAMTAMVVMVGGLLYVTIAYARSQVGWPVLRLAGEALLLWPAFSLTWTLGIERYWDDLFYIALIGAVACSAGASLTFLLARWLANRRSRLAA